MILSGPTPNQGAIQGALGAYLLTLFPTGVEVFEGQDSRVPEPKGVNFIVMTVISRTRLSTNAHIYADVQFTGAIAGNAMTVSAVQFGTIQIGSQVFGVNVAGTPIIQSQTSGPTGGAGVYVISGSAQSIAGQTLAAGVETIMQPTQVTMQLDVHSSSIQTASDMAETISTMLRDARAAEFFDDNYPGIQTFYADDPKQIPFLNAEDQWESRYVVTAQLEANQALVLPQEFARTLKPTLHEIEADYPATP